MNRPRGRRLLEMQEARRGQWATRRQQNLMQGQQAQGQMQGQIQQPMQGQIQGQLQQVQQHGMPQRLQQRAATLPDMRNYTYGPPFQPNQGQMPFIQPAPNFGSMNPTMYLQPVQEQAPVVDDPRNKGLPGRAWTLPAMPFQRKDNNTDEGPRDGGNGQPSRLNSSKVLKGVETVVSSASRPLVKKGVKTAAKTALKLAGPTAKITAWGFKKAAKGVLKTSKKK